MSSYLKILQFYTKLIAKERLQGLYRSVFKGGSSNFKEVRLYTTGDDPRFIDWKVSARMPDQLFVKEFDFESSLNVLLCIDISPSMLFGSQEHSKIEIAIELATILGLVAQQQKERIGVILYSDKIHSYDIPKNGLMHIFQLKSKFEFYRQSAGPCNLNLLLQFVRKLRCKSTLLFIMTDDLTSLDNSKKNFHYSKSCDITTFYITDPAEYSLPQVGLLSLKDLETGKCMIIDTDDSQVLKEFPSVLRDRVKTYKKILESSKVDFFEFSTKHSTLEQLIEYLQKRKSAHKRC
ncbi:MAG: hypothetical protein K0S74_1096 [Chlamydiales bacterium]|jgi:uncharacterized protein (DUF58 family)|nr:hypothetical protein [Chlamydiales bacterium]